MVDQVLVEDRVGLTFDLHASDPIGVDVIGLHVALATVKDKEPTVLAVVYLGEWRGVEWRGGERRGEEGRGGEGRGGEGRGAGRCEERGMRKEAVSPECLVGACMYVIHHFTPSHHFTYIHIRT